ncbi:MAG TPA: 6-bladed beta-propeller [Gemmatimonadales bacterium]|nr:6-bladed beta-propeller [Gemmatimonadales bacterium]
MSNGFSWRSTLVAPLLLAACASEQPEAGAVAAWTLAQNLSIGGADEGPRSFSDIRGIAADSRGRIYVLEAQEQQVRVFGPDGQFVRQLGRNGDGPGEFRGANGLAIDVADRLWVYDPRARRVTIFDSSGAVSGTHLLQVSSYGYVWPGTIDSSGRLYDQQGTRVDTTWVPFIRRIDLVGGTADTLAMPTCPANITPPYAFRSERGGGVMGVPFAGERYMRLDPRGFIWCGDTRELRLSQFVLGDSVPIREISAEALPAPVTAEERDTAIAEVRRFGAGANWDPDFSLIPETRPIVEALDFDDQGRTWVRAATSAGSQLFVFDTAGRHVAIARFPVEAPRWFPLVIAGDQIHAIISDSLDVPGVVRFRVSRAEKDR